MNGSVPCVILENVILYIHNIYQKLLKGNRFLEEKSCVGMYLPPYDNLSLIRPAKDCNVYPYRFLLKLMYMGTDSTFSYLNSVHQLQ